MERTKLEDALNLCEAKRVNLGKAFDKLRSQASELLVLTDQWSNLEDDLKSVQEAVQLIQLVI
ncbi:BnaC02g39640D [Brassica napus]|uniref:BnaC02g39640D protein n=1 Tax=Brassica napus TaxID=3708 RepID=A0A078GIG9_BRANA|nr:BnaC02g39640D [Brassica napus]